MNDEELIKAALQLKKEEDEELAKLLEKAGFLFVPILLTFILIQRIRWMRPCKLITRKYGKR